MANDLFEIAGEQLKIRKPFVLYRKPSSKQLKLLVQTSDKVHKVRSFNECGFIMAPFNPEIAPLFIKPDQAFNDDHFIPETVFREEIPSFNDHEVSGYTHKILVSKALEEIDSGPLEKVVVSREIELPLKINPLEKFNNLLVEHPDAFCYFWYHPATGIWSGATPELFLSIRNKLLTIFSLAGTKLADHGLPPEWTKKEEEEQRYVTKFIIRELAEAGLQPLASEPISIRAGNLWHLQSEIKATMAGNELAGLIKKLHPTPAVCGTPKENAIDFIQKNENYNRQYYTGYLGELNLNDPETCDLFVNLRCLSWSDQLVKIYVGGGITRLSIPEEEWLETMQKSTTIIKALFNSKE